MSSVDTSHLQSLGSTHTDYANNATQPQPKLLEAFESPFANSDLNQADVTGSLLIVCPEFTSLCPKTGQPDFATIEISYVPDKLCVESKSLKLYLGSFRNAGEFHESVICRIANDIINLVQPRELTVVGKFTPRGGIPFWPTASYKRYTS